MRITVSDQPKQISQSGVERAKAKVNASLSKFGPAVISVDLIVQDVNGTKGGVDKLCRVVVKLRKTEDVAVSVTEETYSKAISRAISRSERAVGRKIRRRLLREASRSSRLSFPH